MESEREKVALFAGYCMGSCHGDWAPVTDAEYEKVLKDDTAYEQWRHRYEDQQRRRYGTADTVTAHILASWDATAAEYRRAYPGGRQMPADVYRALISLIDYVADEREDYEENGDDGTGSHIYHSIKRISDWMGCW